MFSQTPDVEYVKRAIVHLCDGLAFRYAKGKFQLSCVCEQPEAGKGVKYKVRRGDNDSRIDSFVEPAIDPARAAGIHARGISSREQGCLGTDEVIVVHGVNRGNAKILSGAKNRCGQPFKIVHVHEIWPLTLQCFLYNGVRVWIPDIECVPEGLDKAGFARIVIVRVKI